MKHVFYFIVLYVGSSCAALQTPVDFSYRYDAQPTGLDSLIHIDGYYIAQRGCDSTFFSVFMFYPDGLFAIATTETKPQELLQCFETGGKSNLCKYVSWGVYRVEGTVIRTQNIRNKDIGRCVLFRDYKIGNDKSIINISDYINPENTSLGYMKNYPSFKENECPKVVRFVKTDKKRNTQECPIISMKWFGTTK